MRGMGVELVSHKMSELLMNNLFIMEINDCAFGERFHSTACAWTIMSQRLKLKRINNGDESKSSKNCTLNYREEITVFNLQYWYQTT